MFASTEDSVRRVGKGAGTLLNRGKPLVRRAHQGEQDLHRFVGGHGAR